MSDGGVLPDGWRLVRLGECGSWAGGATPSKREERYWTNGDVPWVSPKDMTSTVLRASQDRITAEAAASTSAKTLPANSIALVVRSGILEHSLPVALIPFPASFNQDMKVLTPAEWLSPDWALWAVLGNRDEILKQCSKDGVTVASIDTRALMNFKIPVPPLDEQHALSERLSELLGAVEDGEREFDAALGSLDDFEASLITAGFGGRLESMDATLRDALKNAAVRPLSDVADIQYGYTASATTEPVGPKFLRITDIQDNRVDWDLVPYCDGTEVDTARYGLTPSDIVFARIGATTGKSYLVDKDVPSGTVYASYLIRVRASEDLDPYFLALYFRSSAYWSYVFSKRQGIGRPAVNGSVLGGLQVPVPSKDAQRALATVLASQLSAMGVASAEIKRQRRATQDLRWAILKAAVAGKLRPRDGDALPKNSRTFELAR
ncbi:restriction endonuclease subunit S [Patulibacter sp. SYSU D01012]|uniref:restriction endonuclease subunit S n=1 Tax=Patulibacter sp. SYSU D01012 TaxID=2817381 RepID=UPI001B317B16|nr:restriction endonuclease subunit S [Patulibacter sp. SYSU D01012]